MKWKTLVFHFAANKNSKWSCLELSREIAVQLQVARIGVDQASLPIGHPSAIFLLPCSTSHCPPQSPVLASGHQPYLVIIGLGPAQGGKCASMCWPPCLDEWCKHTFHCVCDTWRQAQATCATSRSQETPSPTSCHVHPWTASNTELRVGSSGKALGLTLSYPFCSGPAGDSEKMAAVALGETYSLT